MLRFFFFTVFTFSNYLSLGQTNYKETETMAFNLIAGYQSFPSQADIDAKLIANKFTKLHNSPLTFGIEFAVTGKKSIGKAQFRGTSIFVSKKVKESTNQSASISFQYGYDILPKASKTYLYPCVGIRLFNWTLYGRSTDDNKLAADKNNLDMLAGLGLKQFLNDDLHGVFNNLDITLGVSFPLTNGKWGGRDDTDATFIQGTMKNKMTYFFTLTIGRGFRPAIISR